MGDPSVVETGDGDTDDREGVGVTEDEEGTVWAGDVTDVVWVFGSTGDKCRQDSNLNKKDKELPVESKHRFIKTIKWGQTC